MPVAYQAEIERLSEAEPRLDISFAADVAHQKKVKANLKKLRLQVLKYRQDVLKTQDRLDRTFSSAAESSDVRLLTALRFDLLGLIAILHEQVQNAETTNEMQKQSLRDAERGLIGGTQEQRRFARRAIRDFIVAVDQFSETKRRFHRHFVRNVLPQIDARLLYLVRGVQKAPFEKRVDEMVARYPIVTEYLAR